MARFNVVFNEEELMIVGMLGASALDIDMLYFIFIDHQHHHHTFWPHYPGVWVTLIAISSLLFYFKSNKSIPIFLFIFSLDGMHVIRCHRGSI